MTRGLLLILAFLTAATIPAAATNESAGPPPNLLFQLQKQNRAHPWLRVTTDSSRLTLRVRRIDELGLSGFGSSGSVPPPPDPIGWRAIRRIDETRARQGRNIGFIVLGALGAGLGNTIGSVDDRGGPGSLLGLALFGGLGAWQGGRLGKRMVHERPWYRGTPAAAPGEGPLPDGRETRSTDTTPGPVVAQRPGLEVPGDSSSSSLSRSTGVLRACARIGRDDLIRVRGDFGWFQGFASVVGPEGMEGLRVSPNRHLSTAPVPTGLISWDRIDKVDKRGHGWRRGAIGGGLVLGAVGGGLGYMEATSGLFESHSPDPPLLVVGKTVGGFGLGGAYGAGFGAVVGWLFPAWLHVYVRPEAAGTGR